jgi:hypothetical protein
MVTRSGVKLLDFGLAKSLVDDGAGIALSTLAARPTKTLTGEGTILGTLQYMAPEQMEGRSVDARTDLFAFGSVLYEMVAGRRAFEGESQASLIAAVLRAEPLPLNTVQPLTPSALERLVRKCLAKDPDDRWQTARDVRSELQWIRETAATASGAAAPTSAVGGLRNRERMVWTAAIILIASLATLRRTSAVRGLTGWPSVGLRGDCWETIRRQRRRAAVSHRPTTTKTVVIINYRRNQLDGRPTPVAGCDSVVLGWKPKGWTYRKWHPELRDRRGVTSSRRGRGARLRNR